MKKFIVSTVLCTSLFGFIGCMKDNDSVLYLYDEPAIAEYAGNKPMIRTAFGRYYVPNLSDTIHSGDCLWINCTIDFEKQSNSTDTLATDFTYRKIGKSSVKIQSGDMVDDYSESMVSAAIYNRTIGNTLFFVFMQKAPKNQIFDYEIICNTDSLIENDGKEYPALYLKSKKVNAPGGEPMDIITQFGFDMTRFASNPAYKNNKNEIPLYLYYKTGTKDEKEIYEAFKTYPVLWVVP